MANNKERAKRAAAMLMHYDARDVFDLDATITDAITDLFHLCAAKRIDMARCIRMATEHFTEEGGAR